MIQRHSQFYLEQQKSLAFTELTPLIGATWQARPNLNVYANWNQGTRAPSNVELGCAYDGTLVDLGKDNNGNQAFAPRSLVEGRGCSLPSTLSGDPFLPQVIAQTIEGGARGSLVILWSGTLVLTAPMCEMIFTSPL